jgi:DNA-binding transcriptional LysR family regulator
VNTDSPRRSAIGAHVRATNDQADRLTPCGGAIIVNTKDWVTLGIAALRGGTTLSVRISGGFIANDSGTVRLAARAGHGIASLAEVQVFDDMRAGYLVRLPNDYPSERVPLHLVHPSRRNLAPRTRVVMDFLLDEYRRLQAKLAAGAEAVT